MRCNPDATMRIICEKIEQKLSNVGLMYRIFSRVKTPDSLKKKLANDTEYGVSKMLQDLIGIRVVLYFGDDIETVRYILSDCYNEKSKDNSIDITANDQFKAVRYNIIYSLDDDTTKLLHLGDLSAKIDNTFELQIRTVFSEGWHEVEHDLRYKNKPDWTGFDRQSRLLNGVYASLESSEWMMIKIFDELAYSHYKNNNWAAMLRQKFRIRFNQDDISDEIKLILEKDGVAKQFFRLDRNKIISEMNSRDFYYPLNLNNFICFCNLLFIKNQEIKSLTSATMIDDYEMSSTA